MRMKRILPLSSFLALFFIVSGPVFSEMPETKAGCTQETLADCYEEAVRLYHKKEYQAAKDTFQEIISVDANYKKSAKYLKKSSNKLIDEAIKEKAEAQRLEAEELEKQKAEEEKTRQEKEKLTQEVQEESIQEVGPKETLAPSPYRISVGDVLEISVWRNTDLDKEVIVRPDGVISYPLVGDLPAVGLTLTEIDRALTKFLSEYVRNPVVSVAIKRFGGTKVVVLGEVRLPGVYAPQGGGNALDVIAMAGGFTGDAVRRSTFLVRGGLQNPEVYRLNLARVFKGDLGQNVALQSNDIIYVPKQFMAQFNHVINQLTPTLSNTLLGTSVAQDVKLLSPPR